MTPTPNSYWVTAAARSRCAIRHRRHCQPRTARGRVAKSTTNFIRLTDRGPIGRRRSGVVSVYALVGE
jgi:hypothetical protein